MSSAATATQSNADATTATQSNADATTATQSNADATTATQSNADATTATQSIAAAESVIHSLIAPPRNKLPQVAGPPLTVGIVVPVFADTQFLGQALKSIADQSFTNWRCYVVDDASPENVDRVFKPFQTDERFILLRHATNAGLAAARNTGLRGVSEDVVQFLDADDMLTPDALARRVGIVRKQWGNPTMAGAYGSVLQCPEETTLAQVAGWKRSPKLPIVDWLTSQGESPFTVHAPLTKTSVAKGLGGFDEALVNGAEDWDFWHRILRHGYHFEPAPCIVGAYRQRQASMIRSHSSVHLGRADQLLDLAASWVSVDPDMAVSNAQMPIADAISGRQRLRRAAQWWGMIAAQTSKLDVSALEELASFIRPDVTPTTKPAEIIAAARRGMIRGLGLSPAILDQLSPDSREVLKSVSERIGNRLISFVPPTVETHGGPAVHRRTTADAAFFAETAADVDVMAPMMAELQERGLKAVAIDADYVAGDAGASRAWLTSGAQLVPFNDLGLGMLSVSCLLGRRPAGPATLSTMRAAEDAGARAAFIDEPDRGMWVDETSGVKAFEVLDLSGIASAAAADAVRVDLGAGFSQTLPSEESPHHASDHKRLLNLRDIHAGETCIIIGNGPSLNAIDFEMLRGVSTFGVNSIFLADDRLPEPLTYFVVEDTAVFKDNSEKLKQYPAGTRLFPSFYRKHFSDEEIGENTFFFRTNLGFYGRTDKSGRATGTACLPRFSMNAADRVFCGQSVTMLNLQFAHWMGFKRVILIGMDFSYTIPDDAERNGNAILSKSDDPNHFHPDYFGAGKTWKDPKLDRVLISYRLIKDIYESTGREIINSTVGGKLEIFDRMNLADALNSSLTPGFAS